eukprot:TRINITY_DN487_c1_g1_i7.p1 TRINITY_DN487_c1_g1~~TRINITY_DN487_c1_g1_i7.p1  ORF type:complete len:321 (+),score=39.78 TRINITY_DN487_c1_g1_i7:682-1644(+)
MTMQLRCPRTCKPKPLRPEDVLEYVAATLGKQLRQLTVLFLVDGVHKLQLEAGKKDTPFYRCLQYAALCNGIGGDNSPFVISCCAATVRKPITEALSNSAQLRSFLTPPLIDGGKVLPVSLFAKVGAPDSHVRLFIQDMGGYGRALEAVELSLKAGTADTATLAIDVVSKVYAKYPDLALVLHYFDGLLDLLFSGKTVTPDLVLANDQRNGQETLDQLIAWGLLRIQDGKLSWCLAAKHTDPVVRHVCSCDWPKLSRGCAGTAREFEKFCANFRCLKSLIHRGKTLSLGDFHFGATFNGTTEQVQMVVKTLDLAESCYPR